MNPTAFESIKLQSEIDYLYYQCNRQFEKEIENFKKQITEAFIASGAIQKIGKIAREIKERISNYDAEIHN